MGSPYASVLPDPCHRAGEAQSSEANSDTTYGLRDTDYIAVG